MQEILVGLIVSGCAVYATWVLMPAALRRAAATRALALPMPARLHTCLERLARAAPGCGCNGCDTPAPRQRGEAQPVHIVRRRAPGKA